MSDAALANPRPLPGHLLSRGFDLSLSLVPALLALASAVVLIARPQLFLFVLLFDYWVLSYQHVISTFTRLCFDSESFRANRFLVLQLPVLVLAGILVLIMTVGPWAVATLYFYWQWWHTMRQSYGIARAFRNKAGSLITEGPRLAEAGLYLMPLWGLLHRHQGQVSFLSLEIRTAPVPRFVVDAVALLAIGYLVWWLANRVVAWWHGRLPVAHTLYVLSHWAVFYVAYVGLDNLDQGWLIANLWHTSQYLMFVWMANTNRFRNGVDEKHRLLSTLSQPRNAGGYFFICLMISTITYLMLTSAVRSFQSQAVLAGLVVFQTINFHHFIVDAVIWKRPRAVRAAAHGIAKEAAKL
jgi:hypothetical protein